VVFTTKNSSFIFDKAIFKLVVDNPDRSDSFVMRQFYFSYIFRPCRGFIGARDGITSIAGLRPTIADHNIFSLHIHSINPNRADHQYHNPGRGER
jgi:hypothetical protein